MRARLDEEQLVALGERIGRQSSPPLFLALRGDLGAGKSTLARAIARGAGVEGEIPSPTFNLLFRYPVPRGARIVHIVHVDLYRLEDPEEVWELGWAELPAPDEIVMVEWPERAEALLPPDRWEIELVETESGEARDVEFRRVGNPGPLPVAEEAG